MTNVLKAGACAAAFMLVSCGGGSSGGGTTPTPPPGGGTPPPPPVTVSATLSGHVTAGAAACDLRLTDDTGLVLATGASDTAGAYSIAFEASEATVEGSLLRLDASNCTYQDQTTGGVVTGAELSGFKGVPRDLDGAELVLELTPITAAMLEALETAGTLDAAALDALDGEVSRHLLGVDGPSVSTLAPAVAALPEAADAGPDARLYGLHLAAVSGMGELRESVSALSDVDWTAQRLEEGIVGLWLAGAMRFDASGRNLSGESATPALGYLTSGGVRSGDAPEPSEGSDAPVTVELGKAVEIGLAALFADPDTNGSELMFVVSDLPDGVMREGGVLRGTPTSVGTSPVAVVAFDRMGNAGRVEFDLVVGESAPTLPPPPANTAPDARIAGGNRSGVAPFAAQFDASASSDRDGTVVGYLWDFGNGTRASGAVAGTTYTQAGTYTVRLVVTDNDGATAAATTRVDVSAPPPPPPPPVGNMAPLAVIAGGNRAGKAPLAVSFDGSGSRDSDGTVESYAWSFGDGTGAVGATVSHTYTTPGTYSASLTVADDDGATHTTSVQVTVSETPNRAPVARIADGKRSGDAPLTVSFDGRPSTDSDGTVDTYAWSFGDGTTATGATASHTYSEAGRYVATLTVTDNDGATDSTTVSVSVGEPPNAAPTARIAGGDREGEAPLTLSFDGTGSSDTDGTLVSYAWDFSDGSRASGATATHTYTSPGVYAARLTVTDDDGDTSRASVTVTVDEPPNQAPEARIADGVRSGEAPLTLGFDATPSTDADGTIVAYEWIFGDGTTASGVTVQHTYRAPGTYTARLIVTDDDGVTDSTTVSVAVGEPPNAAPTARIAGGDREGEAPLTLDFDGTGSSDADGVIEDYRWDFGDGTTASGATARHTFSRPGTYTVRLRVSDDDGATNRATVTVAVGEPPNQAPEARIADGVRSGEAPLSVAFDGRPSVDSDGDVVAYAWDFGDGATAKGATATHVYTTPGTYTARLTVTDDDGDTGSTTASVSVGEPPNIAPTARIAGGDREGEAPLTLSFDGTNSSDSDGTVESYRWNFGDGTITTGASATHTYVVPGTYAVRLVVTDDDGDTNRATVTVTVAEPPNQAPEARIADGVRSGEAPLTVDFDGSPSADPDGTIASYAWSFGDGTSATGVTARRTYTEPGRYLVRLSVTDDDGATDSTTVSVSVGEPPNVAPTARIAGGDREGEAPLTLSFDGTNSSDSDGSIASYRWTFGDGTVAEGPTATHTYAEPGTYAVRLRVTDNDGDTNRTSVTVTVSEPPNQAPVAAINGSDRKGEAPARFFFSAGNSSDADGQVVGYLWRFGDGNTSTNISQNYTYETPGTYTVRLTVTDDDGATARATQTVTVTEPPNKAPTARINGSDRTGTAPASFLFNGENSADPDGTVVSYLWEFGNGDTSPESRLNYTFEQAGNYTVRLTVTDDDGATDRVTQQVTVTEPIEGQVLLPIEVLGDSGLIVSREFNLPNGQAATALRLTCSRCGQRDGTVNPNRGAKASVRLNGGAWVDITDDTARLNAPERAVGGIHGGYNTVRMRLPMRGFRAGGNTVEFRFNGTDGFTNGYRIVKFNVTDGNGNLIPADELIEDDPANWEPPLSAASDIQRGKNLWNGSVPLRESPLTTRTLKASCASCHASNGEDLKYFNYSNGSIEARSRFHGLSEVQGKRIASYIRTVDIEAPAQARPWNPPFQPGPGTDSKPASEWAAGAGLDAVLDNDEDMLPFLFPEGTTKRELRRVIDWDKTLNLREMPVAVQFPDWKAWLPEVHPIDVWPDTWDDGDPEASFQRAIADFSERPARARDADRVPNYLTNITNNSRTWLGEGRTSGFGGSGSDWRSKTSDKLDVRDPRYTVSESKRAVASWIAVKHWEVVQRFDLAAEAPRVFPAGGEKYAWPSGAQNVHPLAPHITADNLNNWPHQDESLGDFRSTLWYQLQMTLNAGQGEPMGIQPIDWIYQPRHILDSNLRTLRWEPLRYFQSYIKMYQAGNNGRGPNRKGFYMRFMHPFRLYSGAKNNASDNNDRRMFQHLNTYEDDLQNRITDAFFLEFMDIAEGFDPIKDWTRTTDGGGDDAGRPCTRDQRGGAKGGCMAPESQVPIVGDIPRGRPFYFDSGNDHADDFYQLIPLLREQGVPKATVDRLRDWCALMWPRGDWENL